MTRLNILVDTKREVSVGVYTCTLPKRQQYLSETSREGALWHWLRDEREKLKLENILGFLLRYSKRGLECPQSRYCYDCDALTNPTKQGSSCWSSSKGPAVVGSGITVTVTV